ncbi:MAG: LemA family protein [Bacillota bacterium]
MFPVLITVCILVLLWILVTFNSLVRARNMVREAESGIDVQLKRRHTLIPGLVETVRGYSSHEKSLFEGITALRGKSMNITGITEKAGAETELSGMLRNLFAVAEAYPDLKASGNFLDLQKNLVEIEDQLQYARRYYNGTVRDYNILIQSFPANLVAGACGYKPEAFFEIELATERERPEVKL